MAQNFSNEKYHSTNSEKFVAKSHIKNLIVAQTTPAQTVDYLRYFVSLKRQHFLNSDSDLDKRIVILALKKAYKRILSTE